MSGWFKVKVVLGIDIQWIKMIRSFLLPHTENNLFLLLEAVRNLAKSQCKPPKCCVIAIAAITDDRCASQQCAAQPVLHVLLEPHWATSQHLNQGRDYCLWAPDLPWQRTSRVKLRARNIKTLHVIWYCLNVETIFLKRWQFLLKSTQQSVGI